jgi:hypothetical protein
VDPSSFVVEFPIYNPGKSLKKVSIWEQVALAVFLQKYWSDNQVSCTVTFRPEEANMIHVVLDYFKYELKSISFLPQLEMGAYAQMPYETITREKYLDMTAGIQPMQFVEMKEDAEMEKYCDGAVCLRG